MLNVIIYCLLGYMFYSSIATPFATIVTNILYNATQTMINSFNVAAFLSVLFTVIICRSNIISVHVYRPNPKKRIKRETQQEE